MGRFWQRLYYDWCTNIILRVLMTCALALVIAMPLLMLAADLSFINRNQAVVLMIMVAGFAAIGAAWIDPDVPELLPEEAPSSKEPAPPENQKIDFLTRGFDRYYNFLFSLGEIEYLLVWGTKSVTLSMIAAYLMQRLAIHFLPPSPVFFLVYIAIFLIAGGLILLPLMLLGTKLYIANRDTAAPPPDDFRVRLEARLREELAKNDDYVLPTKELWERLLSIGEELYTHPHELPEFLRTKPEPATEEWLRWEKLWYERDKLAFEAIGKSLSAFLSKLPVLVGGPFRTSLLESASNPANLIYEMMQPFRSPELATLERFKWLTMRYNANVGSLSTPGDLLMQPQRYAGERQHMADSYLRETPLLPLLQTSVPYQPFTDEQRFTHHWCLGDNGTGKTTYLRHFIKDDLERVEKGQCSLIVMDSKKLIREMRMLNIFAPGEKLDGRMTLIDADAPFPLNPFYLPKRQAISVISYMIAGLGDASKLQTGVLKWYAEAAYHTGKNLQTVLKFMQWNGKDALPELSRFPQDVRDWFTKTRKGVHSQTSSGIEQRLADFLRDHKETLVPMFDANGWGLDFNELGQGGKVLLVDTHRSRFGKDGANLLGRLIIALIDDLSSKRTDYDESSLKPVFVVIDEAHDYIQKDEIFADILEKARAQRIGITVAHHHKGQIDTRIEQSLEQGGLKTTCTDTGLVHIKTRKSEFDMRVDRLEFTHDQMRPVDYEYLRKWMAFTYPYKEPPPPKDDEPQPLTQKF